MMIKYDEDYKGDCLINSRDTGICRLQVFRRCSLHDRYTPGRCYWGNLQHGHTRLLLAC